MSNVRALWRIVAIFALGIIAGITLWLLRVIGAYILRQAWQIAFNQTIARLLGARITIKGNIAAPPALLVANHCSYLDVFILGACGSMRFTPKRDVKRWPIIGQVVQSFDVIFVDRNPKAAKASQAEVMTALEEGSRICVFPEGTTNNGRALKPFKPTLFSLAEQWTKEALPVQPVVVDYTATNEQPIHGNKWDIIAWHGDMALLPHLWNLCKTRSINVTVHFLPVITLRDSENRKILSAKAQQQIDAALPRA